MAEAILFGIAEEVLKSLGSQALAGMASAWGVNDHLQQLKLTISTIKNKLLDAEERQANNRRSDSHAVREWLERLSVAVYSADDLFDELNTIATRRQLMSDNKVTQKVRTFFSHNNQMAFAWRISQKIKSIRGELDDIVKDSREFNFVPRSHEERRVMSVPMRDTHSFAHVEDIIGRDYEKNVILDMLLASSSTDEEQLTVIPIVGMGGMGKTTLAQLIFNDPQVKANFGKMLWVCVSDIFNIKEITKKILKSATNNETPNLEMEELQIRLRKEIGGTKYLVVLDDVWNESRGEWLKLMDLLKVGGKGSKIMVTTRSRNVAKTMGIFNHSELQGLSEEKSWELFKKMAFNEEAQHNPQLVKLGMEIVNKCGRLPLAIRTVGSLLYGKEERYWSSFKDTSLAILPETQTDIMSILKLSYDHLWSPLKNCFAYCSLFPKDTTLEKETLKDLWIAEGFIIPVFNANQSVDEAAEDYFQTLQQRCFFQDIKRNIWGDIKSCKMHDLMHDLAQQVAGVKCKVAKPAETNFDDKVLHLSFDSPLTLSWEIPKGMLNLKQLRTFLLQGQSYFGMPTLNKSLCQQLTTFSCLRVLDLHDLYLNSLPRSIGKLIHLRYLNLSNTYIKVLPDSITDLHNLQTLLCSTIRTLPENIRKLVELRRLDVDWDKLSHMPSGLAKLTSLNRLPKFIVSNKAELGCKPPKSSAKLSDLKELNYLRDDLRIEIHRDFEKNTLEEAMAANLTMKQGLTELELIFSSLGSTTGNDCKHDEDVLEGLIPPSNLRKLCMVRYRGQKLPSWASRGELCITLPYLVDIRLYDCSCEHVPVFSQLRFLKCLYIIGMDRVEYMEDGVCDTSASSSKSQGMQTLFFPSLIQLSLFYMKNLKGWCKGIEAVQSTNTSSSELVGYHHQASMQFCKLSELWIISCPELKCMPHCPKVEDLSLKGTNEKLSVLTMATTSASSSSGTEMADVKLKELSIDDVEHQLVPLPKQCLHQLSSLTFSDQKLVSTKSVGEVFATLSSLQSLEIMYCDKLRSISQGLEHLTALNRLSIEYCSELELSINEEATSGDQGDENARNIDEEMPWKAFKTHLRYLKLIRLPKMTGLPSGLQHLTNLRNLNLQNNSELREIPDWISGLSSLEELQLFRCENLRYIPEALRNHPSLRLDIEDCPGIRKD